MQFGATRVQSGSKLCKIQKRSLVKCCSCYLSMRDDDDMSPIFSSGPKYGRRFQWEYPTANEASEIIVEAEALYESTGARSEFCKSKGISYERVLMYATHVRMLERILQDDIHNIDYGI